MTGARVSSPSGQEVHGGALGSAVDPRFIEEFDRRLGEATIVDDLRMTEIASHLAAAGGKRLRPTLVLACALAVAGPDGVSAAVMNAAVAIELFHLASLYHDDVLDQAEQRRGWPSANARWGNERAVLAGDVLLSHAYRLAAELGPRALRRLSASSLDLCCGELAECDRRFDLLRSTSDYERSIRGKTAALLSTACWLGATTAHANDDSAEMLGDYGTELGLAFQIVDDLLDLYGDGAALGKGTGSDLREGIFTLPVLLGLRDDPSLAELLTPSIDDDTVVEVRDRVRSTGADQRALQQAIAHVRAAIAELDAIDLRPLGKAALVQIADAILSQAQDLQGGLSPPLLTPPGR